MLAGIIVAITGVWLLFNGLVITTENLKSAIYFKVIPVVLGFLNVIYALSLFGVIQMGG